MNREDLDRGGRASYNGVMTRLPPFVVTSMLQFARMWIATEPPQREYGFGDVYLRRWWLSKSDEQGNVYLHQMLRSDADPEFHDHEYESFSILLDGEMRETTPEGVRILRPGDMLTRGRRDRHRIEIDAPTISLFVTGARDLDAPWGFYDASGAFTPSETMFRERYGWRKA